MKKQFLFLFALLCISLDAFAYIHDEVYRDSVEYGGWLYQLYRSEVSDDPYAPSNPYGDYYARVIGFPASAIVDGAIEVPKFMHYDMGTETSPVEEIGNSIFHNNVDLISVKLPPTIKAVGIDDLCKAHSLALHQIIHRIHRR